MWGACLCAIGLGVWNKSGLGDGSGHLRWVSGMSLWVGVWNEGLRWIYQEIVWGGHLEWVSGMAKRAKGVALLSKLF